MGKSWTIGYHDDDGRIKLFKINVSDSELETFREEYKTAKLISNELNKGLQESNKDIDWGYCYEKFMAMSNFRYVTYDELASFREGFVIMEELK
jgi:hypothetical protein